MKKLIKGRALYAETDRIWIAQGMSFFSVDYEGNRTSKTFRVGNFKERIIGSNRITRQLLRQGIHHLVPINEGMVFISTKKKSYVIDKDGTIINIFQGYYGNKPGHQGICVTPDNTIFFGEYSLNPNRDHPTRLFRSVNGGKTFHIVHTFEMNEVRHIHFIKWDPYEKCLWMGTGDEDFENLLLRSDDNGLSWTIVGGGSQNWRAIGICFDESYLTWGTDAGSVPDQNHIIRMNRKTHELEILADVEGPCHGCGSFMGGRVFISTGVEGGQNEKDRFARLKEVRDGRVIDVLKKKKDILPLILQYGVIRFPLGTENTDRVVYTMYGLKGNGEQVYVE